VPEADVLVVGRGGAVITAISPPERLAKSPAAGGFANGFMLKLALFATAAGCIAAPRDGPADLASHIREVGG